MTADGHVISPQALQLVLSVCIYLLCNCSLLVNTFNILTESLKEFVTLFGSYIPQHS